MPAQCCCLPSAGTGLNMTCWGTNCQLLTLVSAEAQLSCLPDFQPASYRANFEYFRHRHDGKRSRQILYKGVRCVQVAKADSGALLPAALCGLPGRNASGRCTCGWRWACGGPMYGAHLLGLGAGHRLQGDACAKTPPRLAVAHSSFQLPASLSTGTRRSTMHDCHANMHCWHLQPCRHYQW